MSSDSLSKDHLKAQTNDHITSGLKSIAGATPIAGPLLAEIIGSVIPNQRMDRIADFARKLDERISNLEQDAIRSEMDDEEFTDLIEEGLRQATRATSEKRREYLASLVAQSLTKDAVEHAESRHLLRILAELSDVEIIWLRSYCHPAYGNNEFRELHQNVLKPISANMGSSREQLDKKALQQSYKNHLERLRLIKAEMKTDRNSNPEFDKNTGDFKKQNYKTTPLGRLLLRSIDMIDEI